MLPQVQCPELAGKQVEMSAKNASEIVFIAIATAGCEPLLGWPTLAKTGFGVPHRVALQRVCQADTIGAFNGCRLLGLRVI
jgi:hypothetical protein